MAATILQDAGHEVIEAPDGAAALVILARERDAIDLIVTDFAMPGLNGVQAIGVGNPTGNAVTYKVYVVR